MRTMSATSSRGGMKSMTLTVPSGGFPFGLQDQGAAAVAAPGAFPAACRSQQPAPGVGGIQQRMKQAGESKRGRHSQSMDPSVPTSAAGVQVADNRIILDARHVLTLPQGGPRREQRGTKERGKEANMAIHIGTSGWSYDHWEDVLYPPGLPARDRLQHYVARFSTVELNASFYRWPRDTSFASWRRRLPDGFRHVGQGSARPDARKKLYGPRCGWSGLPAAGTSWATNVPCCWCSSRPDGTR